MNRTALKFDPSARNTIELPDNLSRIEVGEIYDNSLVVMLTYDADENPSTTEYDVRVEFLDHGDSYGDADYVLLHGNTNSGTYAVVLEEV